jgi:hypothetical protein
LWRLVLDAMWHRMSHHCPPPPAVQRGRDQGSRRYVSRIDFGGPRPDTGAMGVRTRGLDIKAGAAKLKADQAARAEAEAVIRRWNDQLSQGRDMLWAPTIRAALLAGTPWLDVFCPGCGTSRAIDLRTLDRHPLASVGTLVLGLRCSWCPARRRCRNCSGSTRCRRPSARASLYEDVRRRLKPTAFCKFRVQADNEPDVSLSGAVFSCRAVRPQKDRLRFQVCPRRGGRLEGLSPWAATRG